MNILYNLYGLLKENFNSILIALFILFALYVLSAPLSLLVVKIFNIKIKDKKKLKNTAFYKPLKKFFKFLALYIALLILQFPETITIVIHKGFRIITILLFATGLANSVNPNSNIFKKLNKDNSDQTLTSFLSKILKVVIYLVAVVIIISELGYDINGLIAGLGLAGLTVSLAAQDTAKNLFGGFIIILDKPFKQGEWIKTSTIEGIVEEITFRSTRIRTFDNTLLVIPNSTLANIEITNWSMMEKRKVSTNIQLEYSTTLEQLHKCIIQIDLMLRNNEEVHKEVINVYFTEIADSGYNLLIHYFTNATEYSLYLQAKENVNFKIMEILEKEKIELAYPSQTIYTRK